MIIDYRTRKLLEIDRVLAGLHPITPYGTKCKNNIRIFGVEEKLELNQELDRVQKLRTLVDTQRGIFVDIRNVMRQLKDLRKSVERSISGATLNSVELFELKNFAQLISSVAASQATLHWIIPDKYKIKELSWLDELLDPEKTGIKTFYIYDSYSERLSEIRRLKAEAERHHDEAKRTLMKSIQQEIGIELRLSGEINVSKNDEEILPLLKSHPGFQVSGETYINVTFKMKPTEEMTNFQKLIEAFKDEEIIEEAKILEALSCKIGQRGQEILDDMDATGEFDLLIAKSYLALSYDGVRPIISETNSFSLENGRHPIVEDALKKKGKSFTPISLKLSSGVALITGANMGGKTVSLKLTGLLLIMMHYGLFVPAVYMEAPICEFLYIIAGDEQSIDQGLSTFGAEMKGIKEGIDQADKTGLLLIDELARGTNPQEGHAISASIIDYLMKRKTMTLITTHFDGLVKPGITHLQVKGLRHLDYANLQNPENIAEYMDYTLIEITDTCAVPKDAINIARLMGLPEEIIENAEEIFKERCN